jgi:hypothetical protein
LFWWEGKLPKKDENHVGYHNHEVSEDKVNKEGWDECELVGSDNEHTPEDYEEVVRDVSVESTSCNILVCIIVELLVCYVLHSPYDEV